MTKLGFVASGDKETILKTIDLLNNVDGLKVIFVTQNEFFNLYIVNELEYFRLKKGDATHNDR